MNVIHDQYTTIDNIDLTYYRIPYNFNVLNFDNSDTSICATHNFCELQFNCFNELVEGAVDLFITEAKFRLQTKQPDQNNNQNEQKQQQEDQQ